MRTRLLLSLFVIMLINICCMSITEEGTEQVIQTFKSEWKGDAKELMVYDNSRQEMITYKVPKYAILQSAEIKTNLKIETIVSVKLQDLFPQNTTDRMTLEIYFVSDNKEVNPFSILFAHGSAIINTSPVTTRSEANLVDESGNLVTPVRYKINRDGIEFFIKNDFLREMKVWMIVLRYLPGDIKLENISGGLSSCVSDVIREDYSTMISIPPLPGDR